MFSSSNQDLGLYEGNPLLRKNSSMGFSKSYKTSPDRLKKRERKWKMLIFMSFLVDCGAAVYFGYQGFVMHEDNTELDPIAFRLAFGILVVLILFKNIQILAGNVNYFFVWMILAGLMIVGHFYGSVRNFLWLYNQEFPCFLGSQEGEEHGFCFRGEFFIGTVTAVVYLICSSYFLYAWKRHRVDYMYRFGLSKEKPSLDELLEQVDEKMQKYNQ